MKKIIVLGGGTAGWLTALLVREFYPQFEVTVVESDTIGILGAGEGTVPHIVAVLDFLKIPVSALMRECGATLKTGIKFTNWHGDNTAYFHNFTGNDELEMWDLDSIFRLVKSLSNNIFRLISIEPFINSIFRLVKMYI